jgi:4-diphosphocytidyl-2-C-methyl-D-erythritol kinase
MNKFIHVDAPAKLNLFLHINGQRDDGYHLLQSVFQLIDLRDIVKLRVREDGLIRRLNPIPSIPAEQDLVVKAAHLLQQYSGSTLGVDIDLEKNIPMGAGLGGGSSDAASTLIGLNALWELELTTDELMKIGLVLGADVPFFLFGKNAFVEGIGEILTEVESRNRSFFLIYPGISIPTKEIFSAEDLTRNRSRITIYDFEELYASHQMLVNDLQVIAVKKYSEVMQPILWLKSEFPESHPIMTGSGSSVFCEIPKNLDAEEYLSKLPVNWQGFKVNSLSSHSAYNLESSVNTLKGSRQVG